MELFHRTFRFDRSSLDEDERTVSLAFSSEEPAEQWFGMEILSHKRSHVNMTRLKNGAPLLFNHNAYDQIGVVLNARIEDKVGRATVKFSRSAKAEEIFQDIKDGIRGKASVGYTIQDAVTEREADPSRNQLALKRVTAWTPHEISIVSIPADDTVGVGRNFDFQAPDDDNDPNNGITTRGQQMRPDQDPAPSTPVEPQATPTVDTSQAVEDALKAERQRMATIHTLGTQHRQSDLASRAISENWSVEKFQSELLTSIHASRGATASSKARPVGDLELGMDPKEARRFNIVRALRYLANPNDRRSREEAAFEIEASDAFAAKRGKEPQGLLVPPDVMKRDLTVGTFGSGGATVAPDYRTMIEKLDNSSLVLQRGTVVRDLAGPVTFPRQTTGGTAYWVAESGTLTESTQAFDQVTLVPKTVGAYTELSRKILLQSSIDIQAFVESDLMKRIGLATDLAAINGSGSDNEPEGILNTTGVGTFGGDTNGKVLDWGDLVDAITEVNQDNALTGDLAWAMNAQTIGKLRQTLVTATYGEKHLYDTGTLLEYPVLMSNQLPSTLEKGSSGATLSAVIFGDWSSLLVGMWSGMDLLVDPYSNSTSGLVRVTVFQDMDIAVRHAESFSIANDVITA